MEIKIGLKYGHELNFSSDLDIKDIEKIFQKALIEEEEFVTLVDKQNKNYLIATKHVSFIEISENKARKIGF